MSFYNQFDTIWNITKFDKRYIHLMIPLIFSLTARYKSKWEQKCSKRMKSVGGGYTCVWSKKNPKFYFFLSVKFGFLPFLDSFIKWNKKKKKMVNKPIVRRIQKRLCNFRKISAHLSSLEGTLVHSLTHSLYIHVLSTHSNTQYMK